MRHKNATSQPIQRTGVLASWFSFARCWTDSAGAVRALPLRRLKPHDPDQSRRSTTAKHGAWHLTKTGFSTSNWPGSPLPHPERCRDRPRPVYRLDDVKAVEG
jgi:hypothetical protein